MKHKRHRMTGALVAAILAALLLAGCAAVAPATTSGASAPNEAVSLGVGFVPNVQFAPIYVGIEKGFFADEGIDLTLAYGFENDYLTLVGTGNEDFMIGSGDQVILGRAQGLPVRYVFNWYSRYPVVLFARSDAGINSPADMAGKRIGLPGTYGANYIALRALLEAANLTEQDIQLESIGFTQAAAVSQGTVDAAVDYAVNGPVVLAQSGISTTVVTLDDVLTMPANGLVTNDTVIAERPALVEGMARAMARSIAWTIANPDEAFAIALKVVPEAGGPNEAANRAVFDASLPFWTPAPGPRSGHHDDSRVGGRRSLHGAHGAGCHTRPGRGALHKPICRRSSFTVSTTPVILAVEAISKSFDEPTARVRALANVSFRARQGEFICLLGPSGSGKSTLLRIIAGLVRPDSGRVLFDGAPLTEPQRDIGFVFQSTNLMPWRSVIDNVLLPLEIAGPVGDAERTRAVALLDLVGLHGFHHAYPRQLSGGMSQRVVLARTLIHEPRLLLLDEPFGALDAITRERLNLELLRIHQRDGQTSVMVTHSIPEAVLLADRVLVLSERPGRLIADMPIPLVRPRTLAQTGTEHFARLTLALREQIEGVRE